MIDMGVPCHGGTPVLLAGDGSEGQSSNQMKDIFQSSPIFEKNKQTSYTVPILQYMLHKFINIYTIIYL